jgi:hypothetical protein
METTQEQLATLVATVDALYKARNEANDEALTRLYVAEEDAYGDILDGGYGDIEYESDKFLTIVIDRIVALADELGIDI